MKFLNTSLMILVSLAILALLLGDNFTLTSVTSEISTETIINGSTSTLDIDDSFSFNIDTSKIITSIAILTVTMVAIAAGLGVNFLGSGFTSASAKIVATILSYACIWGILSVFAFDLLLQIEIFGAVIWTILTLCFVIGVVNNFSGGGDNS